MYDVAFEDTKELKSFLAISDSEYVDVFCGERGIKIISNTNEIFVCLKMPCSSTINSSELRYRLPTKLLQSVTDNSILTMDELDGERIKVSFRHHSGELYYSCVFAKQIVYSTMYADKVEIVDGKIPEVYIDTNELSKLTKIAKTFNGFVSVSDGVACVMLKSGPRVYKKLKCSQTFAATGDGITALRKCNSSVRNVMKYLYANGDSLHVLVTKVNCGSNEEFDYMNSFGSKCLLSVNFGQLMMFFTKTKVKIDSVLVNVDEQCVVLEAFNSTFTIPIHINVIQLVPGAHVDNFYVPASIIYGFFNALDGYEYVLKQKRSFTQLEQDDYTIVW